MEKKYDKQFFSRGFFRSSNGETYTGISLLGNYSQNHPQLGIFYNNSGLKFVPHQIFNIDELKKFLSYIKNPRGTYLFNKFSFRIEDGVGIMVLSEKNEKYEFDLSSEELFMLRVYIVYCINYIESSEDIFRLKDINKQMEALIKKTLHSKSNITISEYNNRIFKDNLVKNLDGEYIKVPIPTIEHELHGQKNGVKTGYYLKLFPEYIKSLRDSTERDICKNAEKYPIQVIVQEGGISDIVNLTEIELYKLLNYLEGVLYQKDIKKSDNVSKNGEYSLVMTNEYKGKKYANKDIISRQDYNELKEYIESDNLGAIKNKVNLLKNNKKLISNKFINDTTIKTLEVNANVFTNFSIARSSLDGVNDDSRIFQLGNISGKKELTLNVVKGDLVKSGKQYLSVSMSEKDILELIYKIKAYIEILNNPISYHLNSLYKNIDTIKYLGVDGYQIPEDIISLLIGQQSDSKFLKKFLIQGKESEVSFSLFTPNILKQLNTNLFVLKSDLEGLHDERYPISIQVSKNSERMCYFTLGLGGVLLLIQKLINGEKFIIDAKNGKYKRLEIFQENDKIIINYYEAGSLFKLDSSTEVFRESFEYTDFQNTIELITNTINVGIKSLLIKSIIYTNNYLKYERKVCKS